MFWLTECPSALVQAHLEMLPRLVAEEALRASTTTGMGAGTKPGSWIGRQRSAFERLARGSQATAKATAADLRSIGIGLRKAGR